MTNDERFAADVSIGTAIEALEWARASLRNGLVTRADERIREGLAMANDAHGRVKADLKQKRDRAREEGRRCRG